MSRIPFSEFRMTGGSFALFARRRIDSHLRLQPVAAPRPRRALAGCRCTAFPLRLASRTVISKGVVPVRSLPARVNALCGLQNAGCLIAPPPARPGDKPRHRRRSARTAAVRRPRRRPTLPARVPPTNTAAFAPTCSMRVVMSGFLPSPLIGIAVCAVMDNRREIQCSKQSVVEKVNGYF